MKRTREEAGAILRLKRRVREVWSDEQTRLDIVTALDLLQRTHDALLARAEEVERHD